VRAASIFLSGESELEGFLVDCVRTGKTAIELASGTTNWIEYYRQDPTRAAVFNAAMTALSNAHYAGVVDAYDFQSIRKLVDVGGGHGRLISMILKGLSENAWGALRPAARFRRRAKDDRRG
jgi:O-methyltransferase domain